jgi:hypothetical protein
VLVWYHPSGLGQSDIPARPAHEGFNLCLPSSIVFFLEMPIEHHRRAGGQMGWGVRWASLVSGVLLGSAPPAGLAAAYTFIPIDVPFAGVTETDANGINNSGRFVGFYFDASGGHAFLDSGGMFSTIVVPFAGASFPAANADSKRCRATGGCDGGRATGSDAATVRPTHAAG